MFSVSIEFSVAATSDPRDSDVAALKGVLANTAGVAEENIQEFVVESSLSGERRSLRSRRSLLQGEVYVWAASGTIVTSLADAGVSSIDDFAAQLLAAMQAPRFASGILSAAGGTLIPESVSAATLADITSATIEPTSVPTPLPSSQPTPSPTQQPNSTPEENTQRHKNKRRRKNRRWSRGAMVTLATGLVATAGSVAGLVMFLNKRRQRRNEPSVDSEVFPL